jgi:hypothetical protein
MFKFSTEPIPSSEDYAALKSQLSLMQTIFKQDGSWLADLTGECKLCGGEIPHGHASYCDMWKAEKKIMELEDKHTRLKTLAGEILSTVHVNFLRGTIKVDGGDPQEFQKLLDGWGDRMAEFKTEIGVTATNPSVYEKVRFN